MGSLMAIVWERLEIIFSISTIANIVAGEPMIFWIFNVAAALTLARNDGMSPTCKFYIEKDK